MSSHQPHQLAIAKATFAASLLRPDSVCASISRDEVTEFHSLLDAVIARCSPQNVQACREWLSRNLVPSKARLSALGKYLCALSTSFIDQSDAKHTSSPRRRLHILYLLNDILHWHKFHTRRNSSLDAVVGGIEHHLPLLVELASAFDAEKKKHHERVADLLSLWTENQYLPKNIVPALHASAQNAKSRGDYSIPEQPKPETSSAINQRDAGKQLPWIMPLAHGDASTPYYDLPAANMIPLILLNTSRPIDPKRIKPVQFVHGPAEENLIAAVSDFLDDVEKLYNVKPDEESAAADLDEMGQELTLDEMEERVDGETYYGWSRSFAKKMQRRVIGSKAANVRSSRSRSRSLGHSRRSWSVSRSRSTSPRKRRRSISTSRSRSRSPRRRRERYSREHSVSRSPSRSRQGGYQSRSQSTSKSPHHYRGRSGSASPARRSSPPRFNTSYETRQYVPLPNIVPAFPVAPSMAAPIPPLPIAVPMVQNGMPVPPPRPPNWAGPWPPPPPPPPPSFNPQMGMPGAGFVQPLPPNLNPGMHNLPSGMYSATQVPPPPLGQGNWSGQGSRGGYGASRGRGYHG